MSGEQLEFAVGHRSYLRSAFEVQQYHAKEIDRMLKLHLSSLRASQVEAVSEQKDLPQGLSGFQTHPQVAQPA